MYTVLPFSEDGFVGSCTHPKLSENACRQNAHTRYFIEYLRAIGCKTIVVEQDYVDRDYLVDFTAYYARCFFDYDRKCKRLHFFSGDFAAGDLEALLDGSMSPMPERFGKYLGFIVVKPLPVRFFGRTCLVTYPTDGGRRFPSLRRYDVHLAGEPLSVESLAFQEQDRDVAACATAAIWSALHKTAKEFGFRIPTPSEITRMVDESSSTSQRNIPNNGLTVEQIRHAIKKTGLEAEIFSVPNLAALKTHIYAYHAFGLPVILGYGLETNQGELLGAHAVTVAGMNLDTKGAAPTLTAQRIIKLYLHDDQAGPFSRATFGAGETLETQFPDPHGPVLAKPRKVPGQQPSYTVIVPVYPKIRISVTEAIDYLKDLLKFFSRLQFGGIEWDVRLISNTEYKKQIPTTTTAREVIRRVRTAQLPRFMWLLRGTTQRGLLFDLLLDATSIRDAELHVHRVFYDEAVRSHVWNNILADKSVQDRLMQSTHERFAKAILAVFEPDKPTAPANSDAVIIA
ncbi:MAG: hypothetical protein KY455_04270 [Euryarchaeota archaeon]|nr:hypothetical protein [Euryarchaeota archaeon]